MTLAEVYATVDAPAVVVGLVLVVIFGILWRWHCDDTDFDMRRVLVDKDTGHVSLSKFGHFIALVASTVALWYEMMHSRLTEWLFTGYMIAWAGANLTSRWIDIKSRLGPDVEAVTPAAQPPAPVEPSA